MNYPIRFTLLLLIFGACSPSTPQESPATMKKSEQRIVLYQMFTRLFGNTNQTNKPWGTIEENGVGKFEDIDGKALSALKNMGYTHIWYTGAIEHCLLTDYTKFGIPLDDADVVKGRAGSPYAIKDYYDINPDLANEVPNRMAEFEELVKRTHDAEMKVIIDFVPNHVARGYQSDAKPEGVIDFGADDQVDKAFDSNNNFYYLPNESFQVPAGYNSLGDNDFPTKDGKFAETPAKATGNDVFSSTPSVNDWFETVKLNYGVDYLDNRKPYFDSVPDTWVKMKEILLYWAAKDIDGFRCDMAEMVPVEFWEWVTKEIKSEFPEIIFIAEIYNPIAYRDYINKGGFDYLYDKVEMYDSLKYIIQGHGSTDGLTQIWQRQDGIGRSMLRFLENHDEQRIASPDFAGDMNKGIPMMAASAFMHDGPIMMYFGQDVGEPGAGESGFAGDDGRTTIFDYWGVPEHIKWVNNGKYDGGLLSKEQKALQASYRSILKSCNELEAIRSGAFYDLHYFNRNEQYEGYSDKVYSFVRHVKGQVLLIVINFAEDNQMANIKIPKPAWESFGLDNERIELNDGMGTQTISQQSTFDYSITSELSINIQPLTYKIITLK